MAKTDVVSAADFDNYIESEYKGKKYRFYEPGLRDAESLLLSLFGSFQTAVDKDGKVDPEKVDISSLLNISILEDLINASLRNDKPKFYGITFASWAIRKVLEVTDIPFLLENFSQVKNKVLEIAKEVAPSLAQSFTDSQKSTGGEKEKSSTKSD